MRAIRLCFLQMLSFVRRDMMLFAACFSPILFGVFFRFAIPAIENTLTGWLSLPAVLAPYYGLFDVFFSVLTPVMFCYVAAMVILEENDDRISKYLFITPLGRKGYLTARLGFPAGVAFIVTSFLLPVFKLTNLSITTVLLLAVTGALQGVIIALLIVTLSTNKLEGMAVTKLSMLTLLGAVAPYFVKNDIQYVLSPLPTFWTGKTIYEMQPVYMLLSILVSLIWVGFLTKGFVRKMS